MSTIFSQSKSYLSSDLGNTKNRNQMLFLFYERNYVLSYPNENAHNRSNVCGSTSGVQSSRWIEHGFSSTLIYKIGSQNSFFFHRAQVECVHGCESQPWTHSACDNFWFNNRGAIADQIFKPTIMIDDQNVISKYKNR